MHVRVLQNTIGSLTEMGSELFRKAGKLDVAISQKQV